jgi:putative peptidoglycan lipid II flippase
VIGVSAAQISALINTQLAAALGDGRISWITYADRLMEFPSALLGVALGTVLCRRSRNCMPTQNPTTTRRCWTGDCASRSCWRLPAAVALWVLATPLVSTLYQYGRFSVERRAADARGACSATASASSASSWSKILAPGFYARQAMATPVKIAFATVLVSQSLALILMYRIGHAG